MVAPNLIDSIYKIYENSQHVRIIKLGNIKSRDLTADLSYLFDSKKVGQRHCDLAISEMLEIW